MGKKFSGKRPQNQPMFTRPDELDFEKRRLFVPIMQGSPAPHPSLDPDRYGRDLHYIDYGLNWSDLGAIAAGSIDVVLSLGNGIAILGDDGGHVWRSNDFGATWKDLGAIASGLYSMAYLGNGIAIIGNSGHIFRSIDYGLTWSDLGAIAASSIDAAMAYLGNGIAIAGGDAGHVFRSTDYGLNWSDLGDITSSNWIPQMRYLSKGIAILTDTAKHIWRSTDYGANWTDLGELLSHSAYGIAYLGEGMAIIGDFAEHIFRTMNYGVTWVDLGVIAADDIYSAAYLTNGIVVVGCKDKHIWRSTDFGRKWADLGEIASGGIWDITYLGSGVTIAVDNAYHVYRSTSAFHAWNGGVREATDIEVAELAGATYDDLQDFINMSGDRTLLSGGGISAHGDADGSVVIAACTAWCKETDSDIAVGKFFDYAGKAKQTLTDLSVNAIYLDYNAGTPQIVVATNYTTYGFQQDHILVGAVFRQGNAVHIFQSSNLGIQGINRTFMHEVEHHGAHRSSGLVTSDGGSLALSITTGILYAGITRHTTTIDGSTWSYWYTTDSGSTWTEDTSQSALVQSYNNIASGKVSLTANRYGVHWVYADIDGAHCHVVYGQGDYTANQAEEAGVPSVLPPIVTGYCVLIAKIINQEGSNTLTITYPWTRVFTSSLATDHGSLAGLADDDHTQYALDTDLSTHKAATTGVHGAGSDHVALFPVASTVVSKFTPTTTTDALWRRNLVSNTPFDALINSGGSGGLTSTNVPYDNDTLELSLPDPSTNAQWGKTVLHNLTRGNSRLITDVNVTTNVITTEASTDDWADNDDLTTASQTCTGPTARKFFDIDVSSEVPATATAALLYFSTRNLSGVEAVSQDQLTIHPFETFAFGKVSGQMCSAAYQSEVVWAVMPLTNQKFCVSFGTWGQVTGSGMVAIIQLRGYWE